MPSARAMFSTRLGGASSAPYASLNLGYLTGDDAANVRANRGRLMDALEIDPRDVLVGHQVHGAEIMSHSTAQTPPGYLTLAPEPPQVDGHTTAAEGLAPLVLVADCLPVALSGPAGVAMLHCGWRGVAAGIIERGVRAVEARAAAIGPGIGPCCFEVGGEVLDRFAALGLGDGIASGRMLDLPEVTERLLRRAGVAEVERAALCTSCEAELFFSHRRDGGRTGRQAGAIVRTEPWPS